MEKIRGQKWPTNKPFIGATPGDFCFGAFVEDIREPPQYFRFSCPKGQGECMIPIAPTGAGDAWYWDGDLERPTITPAVHCFRCGWLGAITAGEFCDKRKLG